MTHVSRLLLRQFLFVYGVYAVAVALVFAAIGWHLVRLEIDVRAGRQAEQVLLAGTAVVQDVQRVVADLRFLSESPLVTRYAVSRDERTRRDLVSSYMRFAEHKRIYDQVRFLDRTGREAVRVNWGGQAVPVPPEELQDKSDRYYFRAAIGLSPGQVYVSPMDLNIEQGRIEMPHKVMLRLATPVFDAEGQRTGIVILNYLAKHLLDEVATAIRDPYSQPMMVNGDGHWMLAPSAADAWGFMLGHDRSFARTHPDEWRDMRAGAASGRMTTPAGMFVWARVQPLRAEQVSSRRVAGSEEAPLPPSEFFWVVISHIPAQTLTQIARDATRPLALAFGGILLLLVPGSLWVARARVARDSAQRALVASEEQHRSLVGNLPGAVYRCAFDPDLSALFVSDEFARISGHAPSEFREGGRLRGLASLHHADDAGHVRAMIGEAVRRRQPYLIEYRVMHSDGGWRWVQDRGQPVFGKDGRLRALDGLLFDVTDQKRAEERVRLAARVFSSSAEGIMITAPNGTILEVNDAFTTLTGYTRAEAVGRTPRLLRSGRHGADFYRNLWDSVNRTGSWQGEIWNRSRLGEILAQWLTISTVRSESGDLIHYVALYSDISQLKATQRRLEHQAHHDPLTGLPNRLLLMDRIEQALAASRRSGIGGALLFVDLDLFKEVNDTWGHEAGDAVLQEVAERLRHQVRETDTVARIGGDEFVLVLQDVGESIHVEELARKLIAAVSQPFTVGSAGCTLGASVGIALFPAHGDSAHCLLAHADAAMYEAKQAGRNAQRFWSGNGKAVASSPVPATAGKG